LHLAAQLGITRADLRTRMSIDEYTDWVAYYSLKADAEEKAAKAAKQKQGRR
jgi:CO/xanthine dehydrogenase Mo-binding subunit